jgi:hypothetical protein
MRKERFVPPPAVRQDAERLHARSGAVLLARVRGAFVLRLGRRYYQIAGAAQPRFSPTDGDEGTREATDLLDSLVRTTGKPGLSSNERRTSAIEPMRLPPWGAFPSGLPSRDRPAAG